ncbi:MAG: NUDIX hydrolase, partial [Anaerolineae bacterium]|nr:NUDIX hydrolase [Anaerolineae bacterium]
MSSLNPADHLLNDIEVRVIAFSLRGENLHVLLQPVEGGVNVWEIPGSPVSAGQSLEEAASGRLNCLTGLRETYLEQLYT